MDVLPTLHEVTRLLQAVQGEAELAQGLCDLLVGRLGLAHVETVLAMEDGSCRAYSAGAPLPLAADDSVVVDLPLRWHGTEYGHLSVDGTGTVALRPLLAEVADRCAQGIHVRRESEQRRRTETHLRDETEAMAALHRILGLSLERLPLVEKFDRVLEILFEVPWLHIEHKGAIFLADNDRRVLHLVSKRHLSPVLRQLCAEVPYGHCLCGQAALGDTVFRAHLAADHQTTFSGITDHGHFCQPIRYDGTLLGVLNLYVGPGHVEYAAERDFIHSVADTLAGIIVRSRAETEYQRLATVAEASPDFICITSQSGEPLYFNRAAEVLLGNAGPDGAGGLARLFAPWAAELVEREGIPSALQSGVWSAETELCGGDADALPVSQVILAPRNAAGEVEFVATICRDIRDRKRAEQAAQALALREKQFANVIINSLPGIFFLLDEDWRFIRWNANLEATVGLPAEHIGRLGFFDMVCAADAEAVRDILLNLDEEGTSTLEFSLVTAQGEHAHYLVNATRQPDLGFSRVAVVGVGFDITDRKALEVELERHASRDFLTGAFNRRKLREHMRYEADKAGRYGRAISLVIFDLDHFKAINDGHGHDAGDEVLREVVRRASGCLRASDVLARWGGEEFVIVAPETRLPEASAMAEKILRCIQAGPIQAIGRVTASFGVAEYRAHENCDEWLRRADAALYEAKAAGRECVRMAP